MTINGVELSFDLDLREDAKTFAKAFANLQKKVDSLNDSYMEAFLVSCLGKSAVGELLADGKLTTLARVFIEFFSQSLEGYKKAMQSYRDSLKTVSAMKDAAAELIQEHTTLTEDLDKLTSQIEG